MPPGDVVGHHDLHPLNVLLSPNGPVLIDWANTAAGPRGFDAALSYLLMAAYAVDSTRDELGRRLLLRSFMRVRGREAIEAGLEDACAARLADPNTTDGERAGVERIRSEGLP